MSVEEVIEQVLEDRSEESEDEGSVPTVSEVIESAIDEFRVLKRDINVCYAFREEAKEVLLDLYRRNHVSHFTSRERVLNKSVKFEAMIAPEIIHWLKIIRKHMSPSPKPRNPWCIVFKRGMPKVVFEAMVEAVLARPSMYGIAVEERVVKFTQIKRLIRDFSNLSSLSSSQVEAQLEKKFIGKRKGHRANVISKVSKPFSLSYDEKKLEVIVKLFYGYWNELDYSFH